VNGIDKKEAQAIKPQDESYRKKKGKVRITKAVGDSRRNCPKKGVR